MARGVTVRLWPCVFDEMENEEVRPGSELDAAERTVGQMIEGFSRRWPFP